MATTTEATFIGPEADELMVLDNDRGETIIVPIEQGLSHEAVHNAIKRLENHRTSAGLDRLFASGAIREPVGVLAYKEPSSRVGRLSDRQLAVLGAYSRRLKKAE